MATRWARSIRWPQKASQAIGKLVQTDDPGRLFLQNGLDGGTQVESIGAGAKEAGPMASILHTSR